MTDRSSRSREKTVSIVESFFRCIADSDLDGLPIHPDLSVQSPLIPRLSGRAALDYVRAVAANTSRIRIIQHIVEGDHVATLTENETTRGPLSVFAKFQIESDRVKDVRVLYDSRQLAGGSGATPSSG